MIDNTSINDLRLRVLNGEDIPSEEFAHIIDQIRDKRRSAAKPLKEEKPKKSKRVPASKLTGDDLAAILDTEL